MRDNWLQETFRDRPPSTMAELAKQTMAAVHEIDVDGPYGTFEELHYAIIGDVEALAAMDGDRRKEAAARLLALAYAESVQAEDDAQLFRPKSIGDPARNERDRRLVRHHLFDALQELLKPMAEGKGDEAAAEAHELVYHYLWDAVEVLPVELGEA